MTMHFLLTWSGFGSGKRNLPLYGVAFSEDGAPSTREHPAAALPSFDDLNLELRFPRQQIMEHKKLDRFLETEKKKRINDQDFCFNEVSFLHDENPDNDHTI